MKKNLVFFILANLLALTASAQMLPSTRQVCTRRCLAYDFATSFPENPKTLQYQKKMKEISEKKKVETDPDKLKALEEEEQLEIDKRTDFIDKTCRLICRFNPEE